MWSLRSLTRDLTHNHCIGRQSLNHWTAREVPDEMLFLSTIQRKLLWFCFSPQRLALCLDCACVCVCVYAQLLSCVQVFAIHGLQPTRLLCPHNFPCKTTKAGCHFLLHGIFPTQGSNLHLLCLLHWQADSLPLALPGKPYMYLHTNLIHLEIKKSLVNVLNFPVMPFISNFTRALELSLEQFCYSKYK